MNKRECEACGSQFVPKGARSFYCNMWCRFWSKVDKSGDCWLWTGSKSTAGYGTFGTVTGITRLAHRVAWQEYNGPIQGDMMVCHRCDNPGCVNPDHLFLGTAKDNCKDMWRKRRQHNYSMMQRGTDRHNSKLNPDIVLFMRENYPKRTATDLANEFRVDVSTAIAAIKGDTWAHVRGDDAG